MHCISFLYLRNCEDVLLGWKTDFYNNEKELQNRKEEKELVIENKFDEKNNKQLCKRLKQIIQQQINMYFVDIMYLLIANYMERINIFKSLAVCI